MINMIKAEFIKESDEISEFLGITEAHKVYSLRISVTK